MNVAHTHGAHRPSWWRGAPPGETDAPHEKQDTDNHTTGDQVCQGCQRSGPAWVMRPEDLLV